MTTDQPYALTSITPEAEARRIAEVEAAGVFDIIVGAPNLLLLDLDTEEAWNFFDYSIKKFCARFDGAKAGCWWYSKSSTQWRRRHHVAIQMIHDYPADHRLILQASLGSDAKRELFGAMRLAGGVKEPSLLFHPKEALVHTLGDIPVLSLDLKKPGSIPASDLIF